MTRWTIFLAAYKYWLIHWPGKNLSHANTLSWCPLPEVTQEPAPVILVLLIEDIVPGPIISTKISKHSAKDKTLSQVLNWVWRGWLVGPVGGELKPFQTHQYELLVQKGCLLWGDRVVVPEVLRKSVK